MSPVKLLTSLFVAFSITIILVNQPALAQGPGGVNTNLEAWYDAGTGVTTAGGSVSSWSDQSGNGFYTLGVTAIPIGGLTSFIEDETGLGIMPSAALPVVGGLGMILAAGGVGVWLVYRRKK